jgi:hypothetical protein
MIGLVFVEQTNSDHYVKLIQTPLFMELTEEEKIYGSPL